MQGAVLAPLFAATLAAKRAVFTRALGAVDPVVLTPLGARLLEGQSIAFRAGIEIGLGLIVETDLSGDASKRRSDGLIPVQIAGRIGIGDTDIDSRLDELHHRSAAIIPRIGID